MEVIDHINRQLVELVQEQEKPKQKNHMLQRAIEPASSHCLFNPFLKLKGQSCSTLKHTFLLVT
jgi:hypothetical protein